MSVNKIKLPDGTLVDICDEKTLNEVMLMRNDIRELQDVVETMNNRMNDIIHMIEELRRDMSYRSFM